MNNAYDRILEYVLGLTIIDTHEHLPGRESLRPKNGDVLTEYLTHYFPCDLVSAGMSAAEMSAVRNSSQPIEKRWKIAEPYWEAARNTGYCRALDIAARDLYGLPRIDAKTIVPLNEAFIAARAAGNTYHTVFKDKSKIELSVVDMLYGAREWDPKFFRPTIRMDDFLTPTMPAQLDALAQQAGVKAIHTLSDLEYACEAAMDAALAAGTACLKTAMAYIRTLRYEKPSAAAAQEEFNRIRPQHSDVMAPLSLQGTVRLQDYMMHHVCRLADRRGLTMQVHTGLQEGNGNFIANSDPALLTNLFMEYRNVRFDIFHIGYPYQQTLSALSKNFANVFIDFCWAHIISPTASVNAMVEYLDAVPANKISGFGGDYLFVDGVYGHQYIARRNVARALAIKVEQGACDVERAMQLAKMILHDNPAKLFGLDKRAGKKGRRQ